MRVPSNNESQHQHGDAKFNAIGMFKLYNCGNTINLGAIKGCSAKCTEQTSSGLHLITDTLAN